MAKISTKWGATDHDEVNIQVYMDTIGLLYEQCLMALNSFIFRIILLELINYQVMMVKIQRFHQIIQCYCLPLAQQHKISWGGLPPLVRARLKKLHSYAVIFVLYNYVYIVPSSICRTTTLTKSNQYDHCSSLLDVEIEDLDQYVLYPLKQSQDSKKQILSS
jgi:hypothetical protein